MLTAAFQDTTPASKAGAPASWTKQDSLLALGSVGIHDTRWSKSNSIQQRAVSLRHRRTRFLSHTSVVLLPSPIGGKQCLLCTWWNLCVTAEGGSWKSEGKFPFQEGWPLPLWVALFIPTADSTWVCRESRRGCWEKHAVKSYKMSVRLSSETN